MNKANQILGYCVMVAQHTLTVLVMVRTHVPQPYVPVAQWIEQRPFKAKVESLSLSKHTIRYCGGMVDASDLKSDGVIRVGSSPTSSTIVEKQLTKRKDS